MKKGTRVSFSWPVGPEGMAAVSRGTGVVVSDEDDGHVLVACDPSPPDARHFVIWCTVTWLTVIP